MTQRPPIHLHPKVSQKEWIDKEYRLGATKTNPHLRRSSVPQYSDPACMRTNQGVFFAGPCADDETMQLDPCNKKRLNRTCTCLT